jgi:hypothetical protein
MWTGLYGIPLSIKGGPGYGRVRKKEERADKGKREQRGWRTTSSKRGDTQ